MPIISRIKSGIVISLICLLPTLVMGHGSGHHKNHSACRADIQKYCADKSGHHSKYKCLSDNDVRLSPQCRDHRAKRAGKWKNITHSCQSDLAGICKGTEGKWAAVKCLKKNRDSLTTVCQTKLSEWKKGHHRKFKKMWKIQRVEVYESKMRKM